MVSRRLLMNEGQDAALFRLLPAAAPLGGGVIAGSRGESITFVRASASGCLTAADGSSLVTLSANQPCIEPAGLLSQPSTTNLCIRAEAFDNAAWTMTNVDAPTADTIVAPDGNTTAESLTSTVNGGFAESTAAAIAGTAGAVSVWVKCAAGTQAGTLILRDTTAGANIASTSFTATTTWQRVSAVSAAGVTNGNSHSVRLFPGGTGGTGTIQAWGAQMQARAAASEYIATAGAAVTRALDQADWISSFTLSATPRFKCIINPQTVTSGGLRWILNVRAADANNEWELYLGVSGNVALEAVVAGLNAGTTTSSNAVVAGQDNTIEAWFDGTSIKVLLNGTLTSSTPAAFTPPTAITRVSFAVSGSGSQLTGNIRDVAIFNG